MTRFNGLTTTRIEQTRPGKNDIWLSDAAAGRGGGRLALRIGPSGSRRFYFNCSISGHVKHHPMAPYSHDSAPGHLTLEEARAEARKLEELHRKFPTSDLRVAQQASGRQVASNAPGPGSGPEPSEGTEKVTVLDLCNRYVAALERSGQHDWARNVRSDVKNHIATAPLAQIPARLLKPRDVTQLVRTLLNDKEIPRAAAKVRSILCAAFNLAIGSESDPNVPEDMSVFGIESNPVLSVKCVTDSSTPGERALGGLELGHFWNVLNAPDAPQSVCNLLLKLNILLGGQRCMQLRRVQVKNVALDNSELTLYDGKGNRPRPRLHDLPLASDEAREIVETLLEIARQRDSTSLFPGRRKGKAINNSTVSRAVSAISHALIQAELIREPFKYQDLRRTIDTRMVDLEIPDEVRNQIQSHELSGVELKHYNRAKYTKAKRNAFERWLDYLKDCASKAKEVRRGPRQEPLARVYQLIAALIPR
jgi:hypothetical protein